MIFFEDGGLVDRMREEKLGNKQKGLEIEQQTTQRLSLSATRHEDGEINEIERRQARAKVRKAVRETADREFYLKHKDTLDPMIETTINEINEILGESSAKSTKTPKVSKPTKSKTTKPKLKGEVTEKPLGAVTPKKIETSTTSFERLATVKSWVLENAMGVCECCKQPAPFTSKGQEYLEVHHVLPLANGGSDTITNAVAICPNCHRAMHLSDNKGELVDILYSSVGRLVRE
jgi:5-methylcytosine-specific restriction endonuclease McrA